MATYTMTGPDGKDYSIDGPEDATRDQVVAAIKNRMVQSHDSINAPSLDTPRQRALDAIGQAKDEAMSGSLKAMPAVGVLEAGANMISGIGSSIAGGFAGLGQMAAEGYRNQVDKGLHMPTRAEFDAATANAANTSQSVQGAGTYQPRSGYGKLLTEVVAAPLGAAKAAGREMGGDVGQFVGGDQGRVAGESIGDVAPDIASTLMGGRAAIRGVREFANRPAAEPMPGKDYSPLREQTPAEAQRMQEMTSQDIRPTLGQVTRDPEQFRFEDQQGKTQEGAALRTRELDTNDSLIKAIEDTDTMRKGRGTAQNVREAGQIVASALEDNAQRAMQNINELYQKARDAGETKAIVDTAPLEKYLEENEADHPSLDVIQRKLDRLKKKNGGEISVDDAETIYKTANDQSAPGDPSSVYMGRVKARLNEITEGAGGDLYREARAARLAYGMEFEDRGAIARLIEKKPGSRTDYRTASEDVFNKTVVNSSLEELKDVTNSLLSVDPKTSPKSFQAVRELQAQTIDYLVEKATEKGINNERDAKGLSAPSLRNAINSIGTDKLNWLLGEDAVRRLETTMENARNVKQSPGRVQGSDTNINFKDAAKSIGMHEAFRHLGKLIPGTSKIAEFLDRRALAKETQARITQSLNPRMASPMQIDAALREFQARQRAENMAALQAAAPNFAPVAFSSLAAQPDRQHQMRIHTPVIAPTMFKKMQRDQAMTQIGTASSVDEAIAAANRAIN